MPPQTRWLAEHCNICGTDAGTVCEHLDQQTDPQRFSYVPGLNRQLTINNQLVESDNQLNIGNPRPGDVTIQLPDETYISMKEFWEEFRSLVLRVKLLEGLLCPELNKKSEPEIVDRFSSLEVE